MEKVGKEVHMISYEDGAHTFGFFNQVKVAAQMFMDIVTFINAQ